ncbi:MAG: hypothetical protein ABIJ42_10350, partial [Acidobacteriota bacterium]
SCLQFRYPKVEKVINTVKINAFGVLPFPRRNISSRNISYTKLPQSFLYRTSRRPTKQYAVRV